MFTVGDDGYTDYKYTTAGINNIHTYALCVFEDTNGKILLVDFFDILNIFDENDQKN